MDVPVAIKDFSRPGAVGHPLGLHVRIAGRERVVLALTRDALSRQVSIVVRSANVL
jgi:hypothetical protein